MPLSEQFWHWPLGQSSASPSAHLVVPRSRIQRHFTSSSASRRHTAPFWLSLQASPKKFCSVRMPSASVPKSLDQSGSRSRCHCWSLLPHIFVGVGALSAALRYLRRLLSLHASMSVCKRDMRVSAFLALMTQCRITLR